MLAAQARRVCIPRIHRANTLDLVCRDANAHARRADEDPLLGPAVPNLHPDLFRIVWVIHALRGIGPEVLYLKTRVGQIALHLFLEYKPRMITSQSDFHVMQSTSGPEKSKGQFLQAGADAATGIFPNFRACGWELCDIQWGQAT